ncbi:MAG: CHAT domain-containing protein [Desulfobacterales bacterium]|nr:CHAT domain-containing protein [Desulfobacterales bacterium]
MTANPAQNGRKDLPAAQRGVFWKGLSMFALILVFSPGCVEQKMSVQEAREVAVSMNQKAFTPPPRHVDDILSVLSQTIEASDTADMEAVRANAASPGPNPGERPITFYTRRGMALSGLGQVAKALPDLQKAYALTKRSKIWDPDIEKALAMAETQVGNLKRAEALFLNHISHQQARGVAYSQLVKIYSRLGDFDAAKKIRNRGVALMEQRQRMGPWKDVHLGQIEFWYLMGQGKHAEAEPHIRRALRGWTAMKQEFPMGPSIGNLFLAENLVVQGRPVEAEVVARQSIREALALGQQSSATGYALSGLGSALLAQGRLAEAEKIYGAAVDILGRTGFSDDAFPMAWMKIHQGEILAAQEKYGRALAVFNRARDGLVTNQFLFTSFFQRRPGVIFTHLMAGEVGPAMEMIERAYPVVSQGMGEESYRAVELRAMRAMAQARKQNLEAALADFTASVPILIKKRKAAENYVARLRQTRIIEAYLDVLYRVQGTDLASRHGIDPPEEAFKMAEALSSGSVQKALGASGARAAVNDPDLANLVRREQDAVAQVKTLEETLTDILASPPDQQDPAAREEVKATIDSLEKAQFALNEEIRNRFPKYADFVDPEPLGFETLQRLLGPNEALVACTTTRRRTYTWAIPPQGAVTFAAADLDRESLQRTVNKLRRALDPKPGSFGEIPDFDLEAAYDIYRKVLAPVSAGWMGAEELVVAVSGPLGLIPLGILPTDPTPMASGAGLLFENYRKVPWLIRKKAITRVPSASAFALQRQAPAGRPGRRAFAGFGDPIYNPGQLSEAGKKPMELASRGGRLKIRGVRVTDKGSLDNEAILSSQIGLLNRLPDTADEIESIARAMGADPSRDVYLGRRASEEAVKSTDLSDRRVIVFASHALVPGDLNGLDQPALALSAPSVTGQAGDGLLTMSEVMQLKLDADWVVLSACNTGAADGAGEEAVSGLGRAFFYAGTRALLVSMWPVETTSAKKLTTGLFEIQKKNPGLSRSAAFRQSILALMDGPDIRDDDTGKTVASYAHPLFWAPFIIVGDSGGK